MHGKSASVFCVYIVFLFFYVACLVFFLNILLPISLMFTKPCALRVASIVNRMQVRRLFWCSFIISMGSSDDCRDKILCLTVLLNGLLSILLLLDVFDGLNVKDWLRNSIYFYIFLLFPCLFRNYSAIFFSSISTICWSSNVVQKS